MSSFAGRVAAVTGAGGGLGRCHALALASQGARVVVNDPGGGVDGRGSSDAAMQVVEEIRAGGGEAVANRASVADRAGAASIVRDAVDHFGTLDILVNNAGILRDRSFRKMDLDDFDLVMQVHMMGTAYVTHAAWQVMYAKNYGRIVCTSSGSGIYGNFGQANYGAAKMAMVGFMNVLALEGASHNLRINCLAPAAATRMTATVPGRNTEPGEAPPDRRPELVTPAVLYMCSEEAPTGKIIHAAGGRFRTAAICTNQGVSYGSDASLAKLLQDQEQLLDMSEAREGRGRR